MHTRGEVEIHGTRRIRGEGSRGKVPCSAKG
jgi:hypothetical protein